MSLIASERRMGEVSVLELRGRLTMGTGCDSLDARLQALVAEGARSVLLDCGQLTLIDSQGIKILVRGIVSMQKRGGKLKLLALPARVREVLTITRLLSVVEAFDDEAAALRSFTT